MNEKYYKAILMMSSLVLALQVGTQIGEVRHGEKFEFDHIIFWLLVVAWSGLNVLLDFVINKYKKG